MRKASRRFAWIWFALAAVLGFGVSGTFLYQMFIGLAPSAFPAGEAIQGVSSAIAPDFQRAAGGIVWFFGSLLVFALVAFFVFKARRARGVDPERRRFLTGAASGAGAALGTLGVAGGAAFARAAFGVGEKGDGWLEVGQDIFGGDIVTTDPNPKPQWKGSRVRGYRMLGRTGWRISDIVLGASRIRGDKGEQITREAIERGVNYVDTAPDYSATGSEEAIGKALQGLRNQVFVATKFCTPLGHLPTGTPVADYKKVIEDSLKRLRTDYVDLVHIHSCDELDRLMDENVHTAFDELKQEGKVRFLGVSTHTPKLEEVANVAIDSGRFDVMMLAYHHGIWPNLEKIIRRARSEQDIGIVAMKTLKGAKHHGLAGFREERDAYTQAAFKWVLSNPDVSTAIVSFSEHQHVDEYLHASGSKLTARDVAVLEKYDREILGSYCSPHCGECLGNCPAGLPIPDVLRHRMYFEDYGWEKEAMRLYGALEKNASVCASCSAPCMGSCPLGIPIQTRMSEADALLRLG